MQILWFILGVLALLIGFIGVFLPVLPTVPFLILAAYAFARSSQRLHGWLHNHPVYGPPIRDWEARGAISRRGKWFSTVSMAGSVVIVTLLGLPLWAVAIQAAVLLCVGIWIVRRPE